MSIDKKTFSNKSLNIVDPKNWSKEEWKKILEEGKQAEIEEGNKYRDKDGNLVMIFDQPIDL